MGSDAIDIQLNMFSRHMETAYQGKAVWDRIIFIRELLFWLDSIFMEKIMFSWL